PVVGEIGRTHFEPEISIGVTYPKHRENIIVKSLLDNHPYEEVAYEITTLEKKNQHIGMGMVGELSTPVDEIGFLNFVKKEMNVTCIRHSELIGKKIKKVAVLGGSGSFAIEHAIKAGADIYITSDVKYHEFYKAENKI